MNIKNLVGKRFAHQRFADSRKSIRANRFAKKYTLICFFFAALSQIRANRVFSPIRIEICVICTQSSLLSHFLEGRFAIFFQSEKRFAENRPTKIKKFWQGVFFWGGGLGDLRFGG